MVLHQGGLNGDTSELNLPLQSLYSVNKENNNRLFDLKAATLYQL